MNDERQKPGPKPFEWDERLGPPISRGHWVPEKCHAIMRMEEMKTLVQKMALDPDFKIQVLGLVEKG